MSSQPEYLNRLLDEIVKEEREIALMEVCGTHTMAIAKSGLRNLLPPNLKLLSGPGCPVCVTAQGDIDAVIELAQKPGVVMVTFGDMMRVPGTSSSLQEARSQGADVRVAYSPLDALAIAGRNLDKEVVFLGIGFETTAPAVAICADQARAQDLKNFSIFSLHKVVPPALEVIFSMPDMKIDGLICPGHVSVVIGLEPYIKLVEKYHRPCVVTGFETQDILEGVYMLIKQIRQGQAKAEIQYQRVVKSAGNLIAQQILEEVFQPSDARWRGIGNIPESGLEFRPEYEAFDARKRFDIADREDIPIKGCACGEVLTGKIIPQDCALFGRACTPLKPIGPCMVSHEGACAAYYRYSPPTPSKKG